MQRYSKYIISQLASSTILIAASLTCIIWLSQSLRFVDLIVNRGLDMLSFIYLTTMMLPSLLGFMLPVALAISSMFTYNKLLADSELVVMRSAGLSKWQLARPSLAFAAGVMLLGYLISLYLLPLSYRQYKDMVAFAKDNYVALLLQEGVFSSPVDGLTVFIRSRTSDGNLKGILVHDNRNPNSPVTMMAESGQLVKTPSGPSFVLKDGNRQEIDHKKEQLSFLAFDDYVLDISLFAKQTSVRKRDEKERMLGELWNPEASATEEERAEYRAEAHNRLTWPLQNLALTAFVLAMMLNGTFSRRGNWRRYTITLICVAAMLSCGITITNLAVKYAVMTPVIYLLPLLIIGGSFYALLYTPLQRTIPTAPPAKENAP